MFQEIRFGFRNTVSPRKGMLGELRGDEISSVSDSLCPMAHTCPDDLVLQAAGQRDDALLALVGVEEGRPELVRGETALPEKRGAEENGTPTTQRNSSSHTRRAIAAGEASAAHIFFC